MSKYRRKFLSILLTFALIMTLIPAQVFAQNTMGIPIATTEGNAISNPYIGDRFEAEFNVLNQWEGNFTGEIRITNIGNEPIENWTLSVRFPQEITNIWNAEIVNHEDDKYIIKNTGWNQDIAVGENVTIGFNGTWKDQINIPTAYKVLGTRERVEATGYTTNFNVINNWEEAFTGEIIIKNTGNAPFEDWMLEFDFDKNIQRFWEADIVKHEGTHYVIKNKGHNANIGVGETLTLGFMADPGTGDIEAQNYELTQVVAEEIEKEPIEEPIDYELDSDQDDLPDYIEKLEGTDINNSDTDGDGLPDGYEYWELMTDPLLMDSDKNGITDVNEDFDEDGLSNLEEYQLGTDPYNKDSDEDGLLDSDEVNKFKTNPLVADKIDSELDSDDDGLIDGLEMRLGTDLNNADSDSDGLPDGYEIFTTGTNPLVVDTDENGISDSEEDNDKDGLSNLKEYQLATDPNKEDTDNDKLFDGKEVNTYKTNPLVYDTDGDSIGDGDEVKLGLNPLKTATNGVADNEVIFEQKVSDEALSYINTQDNDYELTINLKASGNAADNVIVASSQYANAINNDAIIGKTISIDYYEGKIEDGTLQFALNDEVLRQPQKTSDINLEGLKRYYIFNYNEEVGMLVPVPTTYNEDDNTIIADMVDEGTYCVMDLEKWFVDIGVLEESTSQIVESRNIRALAPPKNYLAAPPSNESKNIVSNNKGKKADLVFVVDTGKTMDKVFPSVKAGMKEIVDILKQQGVDLRVSIIEFADVNKVDPAVAVKINGTLATETEGNDALSFTRDEEEINELIDGLTGNPAYGTDREIAGTPLVGVGYTTTLPFRNDASKFVLLITDKSYSIPNCHGFKSVNDLLDDLHNKDVTLSISTMSIPTQGTIPDMTVQNYKRWFNRIDGVFVLLRNFNDNINEFLSFVNVTLENKKDFTIIANHSLKPITLEAPLVKGGGTDTDKDGLTDSKEVKWGDEEYVANEVKIKVTETGYEFPTLQVIWGDIAIRYGYDASKFPNWEQLKDIRVLPVLSDPTEKDSDDDGLLDPNDSMPFINDFTAVWYKIPNSQGNVYAVQQKYGQDNQYIIDFDNNKVYEWNSNEWIESNKDIIDVVNLEDYQVKGFGICDRAGYLVSVDIEEQFNISTAFEMIARNNNIFTQTLESMEMGYLGMRAGSIESYFPDEDTQVNAIDIFKLLNTTKSYRSCLSKVGTIPSNEKVKAFVFQFITDKSLEELEATRVYVVGKLCSQLYMTGQFLAVGGKIVISGLAIFKDGLAKIGSGGAISLALPFGGELAGIPVAGVGVGEAALGVATGVAGTTYATKAMHSGEKAYKTYQALKETGKYEKFSSWNDMKEAYKGRFTKFIKENKPKNSPDIKKWFNNGGTIEIENINGKQIWTYTSASGESVPYIDGYVKFPDKYLHPTIKSVDIGEFSGDRGKDLRKMLEILEEEYGITEIPDGYIVHHDIENGKLLLVDEKIHQEFTHIGGHSIYQ